ncbi:MAG: hypothetical protein QJT81_15315 [Candidatus Thiothrix putei]|uniref:Uncharacterized protein n=1 Tax=Candidatus Thiothrix putei TaxID=3080811 RepID=A0AA95H987_9GAMM|nr:MAG: hypothetical protein QJT81_15315 [Candidatus Thiothrix putei]
MPDKLEEHYGIRLASSSIRHITEGHAKRIHEQGNRLKVWLQNMHK